MNFLRLFFALLCLSARPAFAVVYQSDATVITHAVDATLSGWSWKCFIFNSAGGYITDMPANNAAGTSVASAALNGTANSYSQTSDFYISWGAAYGGLYSTGTQAGKPKWVPMGWISAYQVGGAEPQASGTGPYSGTNPTNADGSPANPVTDAPTIRSYTASITLTCPTGVLESKTFRVKGLLDSDYSLIYDQVFTILAGETRVVTVTWTAPFSLLAQEVTENINYDPELTPGSPDDPNKRWKPFGSPVTVASTPQTAAPLDSTTPDATSARTGQAASSPQAAAAQNSIATAATGATSKDISDLSKNITEEMKRGTEQTRVSGDATKNAIGDSNKLLKDIKDGADGDKSTGPDMEAPSTGALNFVAGVPGQATTLGTSLTNLVNATGLGTQIGTSTLSWSFDFPVLGTQYINLESYSALIVSVRLFIKWVISILFLWQVFSIVREAFSK